MIVEHRKDKMSEKERQWKEKVVRMKREKGDTEKEGAGISTSGRLEGKVCVGNFKNKGKVESVMGSPFKDHFCKSKEKVRIQGAPSNSWMETTGNILSCPTDGSQSTGTTAEMIRKWTNHNIFDTKKGHKRSK